jgi:hypothetical protein
VQGEGIALPPARRLAAQLAAPAGLVSPNTLATGEQRQRDQASVTSRHGLPVIELHSAEPTLKGGGMSVLSLTQKDCPPCGSM